MIDLQMRRLMSRSDLQNVCADPPLVLALGLLLFTSFVAFLLVVTGGVPILVVRISAAMVLLAWLISLKKMQLTMGPLKSKYEGVFLLVVLTFGVIIFWNQFGYQSLWGDLGVYVNAAKFFGRGGVIPFEWIGPLVDITFATVPPPRGMVNPSAAGLYQFHGLPVWPATLGAFPSFEGRFVLPVVLYLTSIYLFQSLMSIWLKNRSFQLMLALCFSLLPLFWHQSMYLTPEILLLALVLAMFVVLHRTKHVEFLLASSFLFCFAFGSVHTSVVILAPIFALSVLLMGLTRMRFLFRHRFLFTCLVGLGTASAIVFAEQLSRVYSRDIYTALFGSRIWLKWAVCLVSLLFAVIYELAFASSAKPLRSMFCVWVWRPNVKVGFCVAFFLALLCLFVVQAWVIGWTEVLVPKQANEFSSWSARVAYVNRGWYSLLHLSLVNVALAVGFLGVLGFLLYPMLSNGLRYEAGIWIFVLLNLLVYAVLRIDIPNNFYASRYFLPSLVPGLMLMMAWLVSRLPRVIWLLPLMVLFFVAVNARMIAGEFFSTDRGFRSFLESVENKAQDEKIVLLGSKWLVQHAYFMQMNPSRQSMEKAVVERQRGASVRYLLSDDERVLGRGQCHGFVERRIPWTISFYALPELHQRNVCLYSVIGAPLPLQLRLKTNDWIQNGAFDFWLVSAPSDDIREITVKSQGWWSTIPGFKGAFDATPPELTVCGNRLELVAVAPESLLFRGVITEGVCAATLRTPVYVPKQLGLGGDARKLGMDVHEIELR
jgi:hypothetical protein